jgi:hypothetical protein
MTACFPAFSKDFPSAQNSHIKNIFIVVANGVRYDDALGNKNHLYTDNIWKKLRPQGTICTNFYNTELTYAIPAQASLLTGNWHIFKNPLTDSIRPQFPTLFEYWKKKEPNTTCYFALSRKPLGILAHSDNKDYGKAFGPIIDTNAVSSIDTSFDEGKTEVIENAIYEKAVANIFKNHPSFVYLNLGTGKGDEYALYAHDCKVKDKKDGCGGADLLNAYYESIILMDAIVWDLWDRIQHDDVYKDKSLFVVLSDHGRHSDDFHGFGDGCEGCRHLNFLMIGPGVKKDFISKKKRTLIDVCGTIGQLCDLPTPMAKGNVMKEILE